MMGVEPYFKAFDRHARRRGHRRALVLVAALGPGLLNLILALALTGWVSYCRVVRREPADLGQHAE